MMERVKITNKIAHDELTMEELVNCLRALEYRVREASYGYEVANRIPAKEDKYDTGHVLALAASIVENAKYAQRWDIFANSQ